MLIIVGIALIPIHTWFKWTLKKYISLRPQASPQLYVSKAPLTELVALFLRLGKGILITTLLTSVYNFSDIFITLLLLVSVILHLRSPLQLFRKDPLWHVFLAGLLFPFSPLIPLVYLLGTILFIFLTNTTYLGELAGILLIFPIIWFQDLSPFLLATTIGFFLLTLLSQFNHLLRLINGKPTSLLTLYQNRK